MLYKDNSLTLSEGLNKALFQSLSDLMSVIKREGVHADFTAEHEENVAIPPREITGNNIVEIGFSPIYLHKALHHLERVYRQWRDPALRNWASHAEGSAMVGCFYRGNQQ